MAKFKAVMNAEKFKRAINGLPDNPAEVVDFLAFRATKDGDKDNVFIGLYVVPGMAAEFTRDKPGYKAPTVFKGTMHRSPKHPTKRLVLETLAQASPLKELAREALKAHKLKLAIVVIKPGDAEPELSPEELAELDAGDDTTPQAAPMPAPAAPPAPSKPAAPARPTTAPPPPGTAAFKDRLQQMMGQIQIVGYFNSEVTKKVKEATQYVSIDPAKALGMLDDIERELQIIKTKDAVPFQIATQVRSEWEAIVAAKLDTAPGLVAQRKVVLKALEAGDLLPAAKAMLKLRGDAAAVKTARYERTGLWLMKVKNPDGTRSDPAALADPFNVGKTAAYLTELGQQLSQEWNIPLDEAAFLVQDAVTTMKAELASLVPDGFYSLSRLVNPILPKESRPQLTKDEAVGLRYYAGGEFKVMNAALWKKKIPPDHPDPPKDQIHYDLQAAFAKTQPFPQPVQVSRAVNFDDPKALEAFLRPFKKAEGTDKLVPLLGYISTGTVGVPVPFNGNIEFDIIAKQGLDVTPYAVLSRERELLLNHGTLVKVHQVTQTGPKWVVRVEQILEVPKKK